MGSPERLYGTIYLGEELLPGARRLFLTLRELDRRVVFLSRTGNPSATKWQSAGRR